MDLLSWHDEVLCFAYFCIQHASSDSSTVWLSIKTKFYLCFILPVADWNSLSLLLVTKGRLSLLNVNEVMKRLQEVGGLQTSLISNPPIHQRRIFLGDSWIGWYPLPWTLKRVFWQKLLDLCSWERLRRDWWTHKRKIHTWVDLMKPQGAQGSFITSVSNPAQGREEQQA